MLLSLVVLNTSCEDKIDNPAINPSEGETVEVTLNIGLADEADGYTQPASATTKSDVGAFDYALQPALTTKSGETSLKPDQLYNLEIQQYNLSGARIGGMNSAIAQATIGSKLSLTLTADSDCQLVIVAWGNAVATRLGTTDNLSTAREKNFTASTLSGLSDMNKMPYVLHLPHVCVEGNTLKSVGGPNGEEEDVRLLLRRLAVRLKLDWTFSQKLLDTKYVLKEVRLFQVPADYRILPAPEKNNTWGNIYPSATSQFVDGFRLTGESLASAANTYTIWMPANAQGSSSAVTAPYYRTKDRVNPATTYAEFVVDNADKHERLYYRAYLGSNTTSDFNLFENTDYHWTVNLNNANYSGDPRIQLLDQTPVVSTNLQPTSNCFMMKPGTNICFNPYKHEAGWNTHLTDGSSLAADKKITSVKVLWQTKDAGTSGDLVMGYVIDNDHHENLVNITSADNLNDARVSVKVPQTKGGNAVIAAYNGTTILWSWHIWVSDYVPARISSYADYEPAQQRTINGTVHKYDSPLFEEGGVYANMVMMDRDLGARKGGFPGITIGDNFVDMDVVNTYGLLYQWGRKDPFFPSSDGTSNEIKVIYDGYGSPVDVTKTGPRVTMATAIQNPLTFYYSGRYWNSESANMFWNKDGSVAPGKKTIYDPCPKGWKVPVMFNDKSSTSSDNIQKYSIFTNFGRTSSGNFVYTTPTGSDYNKFLYYYEGKLWGSAVVDKDNKYKKGYPKGGRLFLIGETTLANKTIQNSVWLSANPERNGSSGSLEFPGLYGHLWGSDTGVTPGPDDKEERNGPIFFGFYPNLVELRHLGTAYGWPVRCIQE